MTDLENTKNLKRYSFCATLAACITQSEMQYIGMVSKEACMILLARCYLVTGQFAEAERMCELPKATTATPPTSPC